MKKIHGNFKYLGILTKQFLIKEYSEKEKSTYEIAKEIGCSPMIVYIYLKKYNIKAHSKSNSGKKSGMYVDGRYSKKYFCIICGKEISTFSGIYGQGKCGSCEMKERFKDPKYNPMLNKHHTLKTRKKIGRRGNKSVHYKHGKFCKDNDFYCVDCDKKLSSGKAIRCYKCNGIYNGKKMKGKLKGNKNPMFGKVTHGKWGKYKNIRMRSSWEMKFAYFLDLSGYKWQYESKAFDLGDTTYTPDFYIPEWNCYIEIKGYWRKDAKKKYRKFKKLYSDINLQIFTEKHLKNMGVIK